MVISYDYQKIVPYEVSNKVGKMTTNVYTEIILPAILDDLLDRGLTLYQDKYSAHKSNTTITWPKNHNLPLITAPGASPDFSMIESQAHSLKRLFHAKRCTTEKAALARFMGIINKEMEWTRRRYRRCTSGIQSDFVIVDVQMGR